MNNWLKHIALFILKGYKLLISPFLGNNCRFYPSCSDYASQAIEKYGFFKGFWLGLKRISKCHPFHKGGIDLVP